jgi:hypothetical protein
MRGIVAMTRLVVDSAMVDSLRGLLGPVELCDDQGRVLGEFRPAPGRTSLYDGVESPLSNDEIERRENEQGGRSLAEILDDLRRRS